jgi:hypothetical protein
VKKGEQTKMEEGEFFGIKTFASTGKTQVFVFGSNLILCVKYMVVLPVHMWLAVLIVLCYITSI